MLIGTTKINLILLDENLQCYVAEYDALGKGQLKE